MNNHNLVRAGIGKVSFSDENGFGVVAECENKSVKLVMPKGIKFKPVKGDEVLMVSGQGINFCVGTIGNCDEIEAGELFLYSQGGGKIMIKNSGDVVINGLTVTKDGKLVKAKEEENVLTDN